MIDTGFGVGRVELKDIDDALLENLRHVNNGDNRINYLCMQSMLLVLEMVQCYQYAITRL